MLNEPAPKSHNGFRNYLIVSSAVILLAGIYVGSTFYSRSQENRALAEKAAEQQRAQDGQVAQWMGGNRFDILGFYASPSVIHPGDTTDLCYSVSNAKSVTLEPQPHPVWPAFSHCVQVEPHKTTTYKLTADDGAGHTKVATVEVEVR